jgi:hypothetical protein
VPHLDDQTAVNRQNIFIVAHGWQQDRRAEVRHNDSGLVVDNFVAFPP